MQPCTRARLPTLFISGVVPHGSNSHAQLPIPRIQATTSPTRMSVKRLSWRRRRGDTSTSSQSLVGADQHLEPHSPRLYRSASELSPISPLSDRDSVVDGQGRRVSSLGWSRRQRDDSASMSRRQVYAPYRPQYEAETQPRRPETAPRSAPSVITSFPQDVSGSAAPYLPQTQTSWPLSTYQSQSYSQNPYATNFSPVSNNPYDDWAQDSTSSQASSQQTFMTSPTSYSGSSQGQSFPPPRSWSRMSRPPGATYPPVQAPTFTPTFRRESEVVDEFTSPTDFALFAEATSSLDISPLPSPNPNMGGWSQIPLPAGNFRPPVGEYSQSRQHRVSPTRLAAPLPPLPHSRSRSSPASAMRRQPGRSQMLAEALTGLDIQRESSEDDDDELPNYEQSQAEVAARKRREAARRARELDEAWSRSRRTGFS
jgi:hypothetical protein